MPPVNDAAFVSATLSAHETMISAHEDRLQRIEKVQTELVSSVAELTAVTKGYAQQMQMMTESVCQKLDSTTERLAEKIGDISDLSKGLATGQKEAIAKNTDFEKKIEERVEKLERQDEHKAKVFDWKMKIAYGLLFSGGGALASALIQHFLGILK